MSDDKINPEDPKLQECAKHIRQVLLKYDCAAVVVLCSGEKAEYLNHIFADGHGPSWSCVYPEKESIRIRAKRNQGERYRVNLTSKMLHTMRDMMALQFSGFDALCNLLAEHFHITSGERAHKPAELKEVKNES